MVTTNTIDEKPSTREAILDAGERILRSDGARGLTTRAVAERAGVQAPTIYRLFGDKDGLIEAIGERAMAHHVSAKATADGAEPRAALRAAWDQHVDFGLSNPDLYRLLASGGHDAVSPATRRGIEVLRRHVDALARTGTLVVSERRAVEMIHAGGVGVVTALLDQSPDTRDLALSTTMFEAVLGAITSARTADPRPERGVLRAVVAFGAVLPDLEALSEAERHLLGEWIARCISSAETHPE